MRCPTCQHAIRVGAGFCTACGTGLRLRCESCGTALATMDRFCGACGSPVAGAAPYGTIASREAEHRQITVAFCDLVGSTVHASKLDPEDWREVVREFQRVCIDSIRRFDGHVAQYLGDGILVYFGFPRAHEDDAERAIRAALGAMAEVARLNPRLARDHGLELGARIGIHTGPVVVGEMGHEGRTEMLAMGATANVAARLQAIAEPGTVVISAETLRLVHGIFVTEELGAKHLKGVERPVAVHRVLQASGIRSRLARSRGRLTPFVGREQELGVLLDRWERVVDGEGQTVLATGAAGIGKSRLILALRERLTRDAHTWLECRGSPYTQGSPFHPTVELLEAGLAFGPRDGPEEKLRKLERGIEQAGFETRGVLAPIASLLDLPIRAAEAGAAPSPRMLRDQTIETLTAWILALGRVQPVVLLLEDVHWFDPSSLDLLAYLLARIPSGRVMALLTARGDAVGPWEGAPNLTVVPIDSLRRRQARELVQGRAGRGRLTTDAVERIVDRGDGIPLFLEELAQAALDSEAAGIPGAIPVTLQDSLTARFDRLGADKELAQLASVIGRELPHRLLEAAAEVEPMALRRGLERLVADDILIQTGPPPEASYAFRHALIQETAYASLLRSKRRSLHARVARALETRFPERAASEPEALARHFDEADMPAEAIRHYLRAGKRGSTRSATAEAIAHLTRGLELVQRLPEAERDREELALRVALGPSLIAARGPGDVEAGRNYQRARKLCPDGAPELLHILPGIHTFHLNRGEMQQAFELAQEQLATARRAADPAHLVRAHWSVGQTLCLRGDPHRAMQELEQALARFDPARDRLLSHDRSDQAVSLRSWLSWAAWLAGHPGTAVRWADEAVSLARDGGHPYSLAYALGFDGALGYMMHDRERGSVRSREAVAISGERGFPLYLAVGRLVKLWSEAPRSLEQDPEGKSTVELFRRAVGSLTGRGAQFGVPLYSAALAEILRDAGQPAEALEALRAGQRYAAATGISLWSAELQRLEAEILLREQAGGTREAAEALLARALATAREQRARSLELRAATSLSRMWRASGDAERARETLAPILGAFTSGLETPDLRAALALLGGEGRSP